MSFGNPVFGGGQGALIRESIKSPNYVPGVDGWIIRRDGSCEFNDAIFRGDVIAANGAVSLTSAGIEVNGQGGQGAANDVVVFLDYAGLKIEYDEGLPGPYAFAGLIMTNGEPELYLIPNHPDDIFGLLGHAGMRTYLTYINAGNFQVHSEITSGGTNFDPQATINMYGENINNTDLSRIEYDAASHVFTGDTEVNGDLDVSGDITHNSGQLLPYTRMGGATPVTANTAAIAAATETVVLTSSAVIAFPANSAFRIISSSRYVNSAVSQPVPRFRKTNLAGMQLFDYGRWDVTATNTLAHDVQGVFITSSAVNATIVMTLESSVGTILQAGSVGNPRSFDIYYLGPASDYPSRTTLV